MSHPRRHIGRLIFQKLGRRYQRRQVLGQRRQVASQVSVAKQANAWVGLEQLEKRELLTAVTGGDLFYTVFSNQLDEEVDAQVGNPSLFSMTPLSVDNVRKVTYLYDDTADTITLSNDTAIAKTNGADGILITPDQQSLIVGGALNNEVHKIPVGGGVIDTKTISGTQAFHTQIDPAGDRIWTSDQPSNTLAEVSINFGTVIASHAVTGDPLTDLAFAKGQVYYTSSDRDGGLTGTDGFFGILDMSTTPFTTTRIDLGGGLGDNLEYAHSIEFDPFTGDLFLFGGRQVAQIDISTPTAPALKSVLTVAELTSLVPTAEQTLSVSGTGFLGPVFNTGTVLNILDQGVLDGKGRALIASNSGYLIAIDYASTGKIEDGVVARDANDTSKLPFIATHLDDVAPVIVPGTISGQKFNDANNNGVKDGGETGVSGVSGVTIYVDADNDGNKDAGEISTTTDSSGNYSFTALLPGSYVIREVAPAGTTQTLPVGGGGYSITLIEAQVSSGNDFGNFQTPMLDFGDAPDAANPTQYPTLLANDGARHTISSGVMLGSAIDAESDGQPTANADGDDLAGSDDEDGVSFDTALAVGSTANITVNASVSGFLNAWVDFNNDGDWDDAGEQVFTNTALSSGNNTLNINVPAGATAADTYARFRFTTASGAVLPTGLQSDGEVEDYKVTIGAGATTASVGNFVWEDQNSNGVQDAGEPGIAGVMVMLEDAAVANVALSTKVTDSNGAFLFDNLAAGSYKLRFTPPTGAAPTLLDAGTDDAVDSDSITANNLTAAFTLTAGQVDLTRDAGFAFIALNSGVASTFTGTLSPIQVTSAVDSGGFGGGLIGVGQFGTFNPAVELEIVNYSVLNLGSEAITQFQVTFDSSLTLTAASTPDSHINPDGTTTPVGGGGDLTFLNNGFGTYQYNVGNIWTIVFASGSLTFTSTTGFLPGTAAGTTNIANNTPFSLYFEDGTTLGAQPATISGATQTASGMVISGGTATLPTVSIVATDATASEDGDTGQFTITRTGDTTNALVVDVTFGGTAGANDGTDYPVLPTSVTILAGDSSATIGINPIDDNALEGTEQVNVVLDSLATYTVDAAKNNASVDITDNEVAIPTVSIAATDATASEAGPTNGQFTITRTGATTNALTVNFTTSTSTATSGNDFTAIGTSATIPAGASFVTISVVPVDDADVESDETVKAVLAVDNAYAIDNTNSNATVTITSDDVAALPTVSIVANDATASEAGPTNGQITVSRTGNTTNALTVNFTTNTSTATPGQDYNDIGTSVVIPVGASQVTIDIVTVDNNNVEQTELVVVVLANDAVYTVDGSSNTALVTIVDDDLFLPAISIVANDATATEQGPTNGQFTVTRSGGGTASALTVNFTTGTSTATSGADYANIGTSVVIPAGSATATVDVVPVDDSDIEGNETVIVVLAADAAYTVNFLGSTDTVTIEDNDAASPEISVSTGQTVLTDNQATAIDLGTVSLGEVPPTATFNILNEGTGNLNISSITLPTGFALSSVFVATSLAPNNQFAFTAVLNTAQVADFSGNIVIASDDADEAAFEIPVAGSVTNVIFSDSFESGALTAWSTEGDVQVIDDGTGSNQVVALTEGSDAAFAQSFDLPANVGTLVFDYQLIDPDTTDMDAIEVRVGGTLVFTQLTADFVGNSLVAVVPIDLTGFAGQNGVAIEIRLKTTNPVDAQLIVDNVQILADDSVILPLNSKTPVKYADANGANVTITLKGNGTGELFLPSTGSGSDALKLTLTGTDAKTTVAVKTDNGNNTNIREIIVSGGDLGKLLAAQLNLLRKLDAPDGTISQLTLGDILPGEQTVINVGGDDNSKAAKFQLGHIDNLSLTTMTQLKEFRAMAWKDTDAMPDTFDGTMVKTLRTTGGNGNPGDFEANLTLGGVTGVPTTLNKVIIPGQLANVVWDILNNINSILVTGLTTNFTLENAMNLKKLTLGIATATTIDIDGALSKAQAMQWDGGLISADTLGTLKTTGVKGDAARNGTYNAGILLANMNDAAIAAKSITIADNASGAWSFEGSAKTIKIGGQTQNLSIDIFNQPNAGIKKLQVNDAMGLTVKATGVLSNATAKNWDGGLIEADSIGKLTITGDKNNAALPGDLKNMTITVLKDAATPGFGINKLTVKNKIENVQVRSDSNVGTVKTGQFIQSQLLVGAKAQSAVGLFPGVGAAANFFDNTALTLKSFTSAMFDRSAVAVPVISKLAVGQIINDADTQPFGLAAGFIKKLTGNDGVDNTNLKNVDVQADAQAIFDDATNLDPDFAIELF